MIWRCASERGPGRAVARAEAYKQHLLDLAAAEIALANNENYDRAGAVAAADTARDVALATIDMQWRHGIIGVETIYALAIAQAEKDLTHAAADVEADYRVNLALADKVRDNGVEGQGGYDAALLAYESKQHAAENSWQTDMAAADIRYWAFDYAAEAFALADGQFTTPLAAPVAPNWAAFEAARAAEVSQWWSGVALAADWDAMQSTLDGINTADWSAQAGEYRDWVSAVVAEQEKYFYGDGGDGYRDRFLDREQAIANAEHDQRETTANAARDRAQRLADHDFAYVAAMAGPAETYVKALATDQRDQLVGADPTDALESARAGYLATEATAASQLRDNTASAEHQYAIDASGREVDPQTGPYVRWQRDRQDAELAFADGNATAIQAMNEAIALADATYGSDESDSLATVLADFDVATDTPWSTFASSMASASDEWYTSLTQPTTSVAEARLVLYHGDGGQAIGQYEAEATFRASHAQAAADFANTTAVAAADRDQRLGLEKYDLASHTTLSLDQLRAEGLYTPEMPTLPELREADDRSATTGDRGAAFPGEDFDQPEYRDAPDLADRVRNDLLLFQLNVWTAAPATTLTGPAATVASAQWAAMAAQLATYNTPPGSNIDTQVPSNARSYAYADKPGDAANEMAEVESAYDAYFARLDDNLTTYDPFTGSCFYCQDGGTSAESPDPPIQRFEKSWQPLWIRREPVWTYPPPEFNHLMEGATEQDSRRILEEIVRATKGIDDSKTFYEQYIDSYASPLKWLRDQKVRRDPVDPEFLIHPPQTIYGRTLQQIQSEVADRKSKADELFAMWDEAEKQRRRVSGELSKAKIEAKSAMNSYEDMKYVDRSVINESFVLDQRRKAIQSERERKALAEEHATLTKAVKEYRKLAEHHLIAAMYVREKATEMLEYDEKHFAKFFILYAEETPANVRLEALLWQLNCERKADMAETTCWIGGVAEAKQELRESLFGLAPSILPDARGLAIESAADCIGLERKVIRALSKGNMAADKALAGRRFLRACAKLQMAYDNHPFAWNVFMAGHNAKERAVSWELREAYRLLVEGKTSPERLFYPPKPGSKAFDEDDPTTWPSFPHMPNPDSDYRGRFFLE